MNPTIKLHRLPASVQVVLLTLGFAGIYAGLRALPSAECGFLHYEVQEILADGTEVCAATNHAKFIDLEALPFPVSMELKPDQTPRAGERIDFRVRFLDRHGSPILPHQLAVTHTERIHLMIIDPSLEDYHHLHPQPDGNTGYYHFSFTPAAGGEYGFYAEMVPVRTRRQVVARHRLSVEGPVPAVYAPEPGRTTLAGSWGDYRFELVSGSPAFRRNRDNRMLLRAEHRNGGPVDLEFVMGAQAHLVAFDESRTGFAHMHPASLEPVGGVAPEIPFLFYSTKTGAHRIWAQLQLHGQEVFVPFDVMVQ